MSIRITGGILRNRKLAVPESAAVRPTTEKMRQAVFNLLAHASWGIDIEGAHVLDGFCGSGIMGLECLSRGAAHVTFADFDAKVLAFLKAQIAPLGLPASCAETLRTDLTQAVLRPQTPYDLVFLDPPYRKDMVAPVLTRLSGEALRDGALVLFEIEKRAMPEFDRTYYTLEDDRIYGESRLIALRSRAV